MATLSPSVINLPLNLPAGSVRIFKFQFLVTTSSATFVNVDLSLAVTGSSAGVIPIFLAWQSGATPQTIQPLTVSVNNSTSATVSVFVQVSTPAGGVVGNAQNASFSVTAVQAGSPNAVANISLAGTVAPPLDNRAGVALVIDQTLGDPSVAQWENVQAAGETLIGFMRNDDWFNLYSLAPAANPQLPSSSALLQPLSYNRTKSLNWLANMATLPVGSIYVNSGLDYPGSILKQMNVNCVCAPGERGVLLLSGEHASFSGAVINHGPRVKKYAVWLGAAPASQPSGTYTTVTIDDATQAVDQFRLQKFMLQIIGELSGTGVVSDPAGSLQGDQSVEIPFHLTDADSDVRVIVLNDGVERLHVELEAEGKPISGGRNAEAKRRKTGTFVEVTVPRSHLAGGKTRGCGCGQGDHPHQDEHEHDRVPAPSGQWKAKLSLKRHDDSDDDRPVNYSLVVLASSRIKLFAQVEQDGHDVGGVAYITARVEDSGLVLDSTFVKIRAEVTFPDGSVHDVPLSETLPGRFEKQLRLTQPGAAIVRVMAVGQRLHGFVKPEESKRSHFEREASFTTHTARGVRHCGPAREPKCDEEPRSPKRPALAEPASVAPTGEEAASTPEPARPTTKSLAQRLLGAVARELLN